MYREANTIIFKCSIFSIFNKNINQKSTGSIEKNIDDTGEEIVNVVATGSGSVTKEDIEKELEKLHAEKNIDISSGNVNIEINVEETK